MNDNIKCAVCGKEVSEKCMALVINYQVDYSLSGDLQKSLGPYAGRKTAICYECWLKAMGVPVEKKERFIEFFAYETIGCMPMNGIPKEEISANPVPEDTRTYKKE